MDNSRYIIGIDLNNKNEISGKNLMKLVKPPNFGQKNL